VKEGMTSVREEYTEVDMETQAIRPTVLQHPKKGLANIGNTCYLNSAIQALRYTKSFEEYVRSNAWQQHRHPTRKGFELAKEIRSLIVNLNSSATTEKMIVPQKFVQSFIRFAQQSGFDEFRFGSQGDAAEAIQLLLDGLHTQQAREVRMDISGTPTTREQTDLVESLKSWASFFSKEYSPFVESFYGQTQTRMICTKCNHSSSKYEPWGILKLPIPGAEKAGNPAPSLHACIREALSTETIEDYTCDGCKNKGVVRVERYISRFPKYMVLVLKRFTNMGAKVHARIPYNEENIDFTSWIAWPTLQKTSMAQYRVYATIEHLGGSRCGHYVSRVRSHSIPETDPEEKGTRAPATGTTEWLMYDDGSCFVSREGGAAGPDTYILFLEQKGVYE
jgi:ubiquitin carboxyl-terminal hydrolase 2